jgi:predicted Zn-dependent peptidase
MMGGNMSSRLFTEVREKRGLAYFVSSGSDMQTDTGNFMTWAGVDCDKVLEAIKVIMDEYRRVACEKVPLEELERAKECIIGSTRLSLETPDAIACRIGRQWSLQGEILPLLRQEKLIRKVTPEDIMRVAKDIFKDEKLNLAIAGPLAGMEDEARKLLKF